LVALKFLCPAIEDGLSEEEAKEEAKNSAYHDFVIFHEMIHLIEKELFEYWFLIQKALTS
jgi:hypothetical protein